MSYKDRGSPILLESGLKSFLGHPGHNYPLLNDTYYIRKVSSRPSGLLVRSILKFSVYRIHKALSKSIFHVQNRTRVIFKIAGSVWPRDNYGYISMSTSDSGCCQQVRVPLSAPYEHPSTDNVPVNRNWSQDQTWLPNYFNQQNGMPHKTCIHQPGNSKPTHPHGHGHSAIKDLASSILGNDDKKDDGELWNNVDAQTAFLGPNLWDKSYESDLKYVDLDEFLSENGVSMDGLGSHGSASLSSGHGVTKRERSPSPSDCMSPDTINPPSPADSTLSMASSCRDFDPRTRVFSDEELKPQPLIKKSRKQFVPDDLKDDKYWARRRKNNLAAKRSRDARRMKENQIALRAGYLEKENVSLRNELERLKKENLMLQNKLAKYEDV
ncbi:hepatic leukemia factor isoform X2 [Agrilus planipennis]|uniref:Hepatic leukemia factor isoform X2 n=1 Tax=Agrilus planipennis TaxID=224129 RepID=A0A7F5RI45_AGRPL|nr:hepatic leukemia factor isoform X2 [Agrilus planipennis]